MVCLLELLTESCTKSWDLLRSRPTLKKELAGITLAPGDFRKEWGRLLKTIPKEDFAKTFVRWQERCEKCIRIGGSYVEKS
jgi:hypothetical protein